MICSLSLSYNNNCKEKGNWRGGGESEVGGS